MKKYIQILNSVICVDDIRKISIYYHNGTNYDNKYIHTLDVFYKDGTDERFQTTDLGKAKEDYEALRNVLLGNENCILNCEECNKKILEVKYEAHKDFVEMLCDGKVSNDNTVIEAQALLKELWEGVMM